MERDDIENSSFLIEMEEKIPHIAYTKWEEEKIKMTEEGYDITIDSFIEFYTNLVNIEEKRSTSENRPNLMTNPILIKTNHRYTKPSYYTPIRKKKGRTAWLKVLGDQLQNKGMVTTGLG